MILFRILLAILLLASPVFSAEVLVQISDNWMLSADTTDWSQGKRDKRRRQKLAGSPIVVVPDTTATGDPWVWGGEERPPRFIVIALPGFPADTLRKYLQPLMDGDSTIALRRFTFPKSFIDSVKVRPDGKITINKNKKQIQKWLDGLIVEKELAEKSIWDKVWAWFQ